jgi:pSer/pThr/pTyr-binding forkhead associated (FHA) protein
MPVRLIALNGEPDISVDKTPVLVGRDPRCDVRIDSIRVSRRHCVLLAGDDDQVMVRDLGSTNGIRINGGRVEAGRLRPGDELTIAHLRYRVGEGQVNEVVPPG